MNGTEPLGWGWDVRIIEAGLSDSGRYYPREVLAAAMPLYIGVPVRALEVGRGQFYHASDAQYRSLTQNQVGRIEWAWPGTDGGIEGHLHVATDANWLRQKLLDGWRRGVFALGLSHVVRLVSNPQQVDGRSVEYVHQIRSVESVDVVTVASAGGCFKRPLEVDPALTSAQISLGLAIGMERILKKALDTLMTSGR